MCLSSPPWRNCSLTMECLKNSLQIPCIYAELLNSAVCCSFFFFFWCFWWPLLLLHIGLPAPLSWALLTTSFCSAYKTQRAAPGRRSAGCGSPCPRLSMHRCRDAARRGQWGGRGRHPITGRALLSGLPGANANPAPFGQKTQNAQNWHLIPSLGSVGPCGSNTRPPGCPFHEGGVRFGRGSPAR